MTRRAARVVAWAALLPSCVLLSPRTAAASGTAIARFGGEHGTVNATNPTALYYNPGAIGFANGTQVLVDGQLALRSLHWTHAMGQGDVPEPAGASGANYGTAKALNVFGGPMLGGSTHIGPLALGAAAYAPFGGQVSFDRNDRFADGMYPGAADGVARWHAIEASTLSVYGTLGAAYRIGPVSFGLSGNLIYTTLSLRRAQTLRGDNDLDREGRSRLNVSGVHGSFGLGVMVEALPDRLWLAVSYQAQPGLGAMKLDGTLGIDASVPATEPPLSQKVTFHQALPDIWRAGARLRLGAASELRLAADVTRWSLQRTQCISLRDTACQVTPDGDAAQDSGTVQNLRRYWKDTFGVRVGGSHFLTPGLELFAGLGYETAATPDSTLDPVLPDASNVALAIGAAFDLAEHFRIAAGYTHLQFVARDNTGKSQLADPELAVVTRRVDGGGRYTQWVGVLDVNLLAKF